MAVFVFELKICFFGSFRFRFRAFFFNRQVWMNTEEYLKDALGSVVTDIGDLAINLLDFVNEQVGGYTSLFLCLAHVVGASARFSSVMCMRVCVLC